MYTCRYMFIWATCPTTVEMDLTFVLVVRFVSLKLNGSCYLVHVWPFPGLSVYREPMREPRFWMTWMCVGGGVRGTENWTFRDREGYKDFASSCRMDECFISIVFLTRTRASLETALRHTSIATRPSAPLPVRLHLWRNRVQRNRRNC